MATISEDLMTVKIDYADRIGAEWIEYRLLIQWDDAPVLNDAILKRNAWDREDLSWGMIRVFDDMPCRLLAVLDAVSRTGQPACWEPHDQDIVLAVYPDRRFPFREGLPPFSPASQGMAADPEAEETTTAAQDVAEYDLVLFLDSDLLQRRIGYGGPHVGIRLSVSCHDLAAFQRALRAEYARFVKRHQGPR